LRKEESKMFKDLKLSVKIAGGFAVVLILTAVVGFVGYNGLSGVTVIVDTADDANRLIKFAEDGRIQEKNFMLRENKKSLEEHNSVMEEIYEQIDTTMAKLDDPADRERMTNVDKKGRAYKENFDGWVELWNKQQTEANDMVTNARAFLAECEIMRADQSKKLEEDMADANLSLEKKMERLWKADAANRLIKFVLECRRQEKNFMLREDKKYQKENDETMGAIYALCDELYSKFNQQVNKDQTMKVKKGAEQYKEGFDGWIALWDQQQQVETSMVENARAFVEECEELRAGQKTKMDSTTARSNTMMVGGALVAIALGTVLAFVITRSIVKPINRVIEGMNAGSEQVSSASIQVSSASQSLAQGASEQASALEESSSALEEAAGMAKQNADNAQSANQISVQAQEAAEKGQVSMNEMTSAVSDINQSSDQISKIIKVIEEIAFQTNLLALNAAVEAARAGDAGKGFAVVAEEVRNLAKRSADAAKDTNELIGDSVDKAKRGQTIADESAKSLEEIVGNVKKAVDLIGEIAAASQEQAQGIEQINTAVGQMDQVTQQNASNAEESASASEELSAQSQNLQAMVMDLSRIVGGNTTDSTSSTTSSTTSVATNKPQDTATPSHTNRISQGFDKLTNHLVKRGQSEETQTPQAVIPMSDDDFKS
jgi:methyl-accepting chemotaxis protein